jgi:hypothetical protein
MIRVGMTAVPIGYEIDRLEGGENKDHPTSKSMQ